MNAIRKFDLKAIVACVIVFGIVQGLLFGEIIGPFWELNIILICINIILAVSLNLINGYTGQFSIGHAGFMAVGAYTSAIMTVKLGMPFEAGLVAAPLAAGLLGIFLGGLGVHNFYLGNTGKAVAQLLLTLVGWILLGLGPIAAAIWGFVEGIIILCSKPGSPWHKDANGYELSD